MYTLYIYTLGILYMFVLSTIDERWNQAPVGLLSPLHPQISMLFFALCA